MPKRVRHSHFVPRLHLRRFAVDGRLWVYDRTAQSFRRQSVMDTAVRKDYYALPTPHGLSDVVEHELARIEGAAAPVIERLVAADPGSLTLSQDDRDVVATYVAALHGRVPATREPSQQLARLINEAAWLQGISPEGRFLEWLVERGYDRAEAESIRQEVWRETMSGNVSIETSEASSLVAIEAAIEAIAPRLSARHWTVLKRSRAPWLISGDAPVVVWPGVPHGSGRDVGFDTPAVEVFTVLAPDVCVVITQAPLGTEEVVALDDDEFSLGISLRVWSTSNRFVYGRSRRDLEAVAARLEPEQRDNGAASGTPASSLLEVVRTRWPNAKGFSASDLLERRPGDK